uniref:Zgc:112416 n=1 Tax=Paramormyrops kingsleyae TaxID=1676925 RepID=A0A3B3SD21_9TELE
MLDQMTKLRLRLMERSCEDQELALHRALKRKRNLLQRMRIPQQPTTIIQQLPQQQPIIAQVPPPLPFSSSKSGSIKEMMELMLMQNAQMHQIIMHNMMLKAIPLGALPPPGGAGQAPARQHLTHPGQRGYSVHHHHHYSIPAVPLPPIGCPLASPVMSPAGQGGTFHPTLHHMTGPIMLSPLN